MRRHEAAYVPGVFLATLVSGLSRHYFEERGNVEESCSRLAPFSDDDPLK